MLNEEIYLKLFAAKTALMFERLLKINTFISSSAEKRKLLDQQKPNRIRNIPLLTLIKLQDGALCTQVKEVKSQFETEMKRKLGFL